MADYSLYPTVQDDNPDIEPNNQVSANNIVGSAALGGSSGVSLGGKGGFNGTQGIWLGGSTPSRSNFSVDVNGNMTARSLTISGFIHTGGAAGDVNSGGTTVNGGKITTGTVTATQIAASTITGTNVAASTITATNLSVSTLSAISANLGTITAGTITGTTITGGTVQTAASGKRVVLNGAADEIDIFDSSAQVATISGSSSQLIVTAPSGKTINLIVVSGASLELLPSSLSLSDASGNGLTVDAGGNASVAGTTVNLFGNTAVVGNLSATGTKPFDIPHPSRDGYRLRYVALEGPEVLVVCRGRGRVLLPAHFTDVSEPGTLAVVRSGWPWNRTWIATAVRKGYLGHVTEYEGSSPSDHPSGDEV